MCEYESEVEKYHGDIPDSFEQNVGAAQPLTSSSRRAMNDKHGKASLIFLKQVARYNGRRALMIDSYLVLKKDPNNCR